MYRFNAEDPGQSLYTPTTVGVIDDVSLRDITNMEYNILVNFLDLLASSIICSATGSGYSKFDHQSV